MSRKSYKTEKSEDSGEGKVPSESPPSKSQRRRKRRNHSSSESVANVPSVGYNVSQMRQSIIIPGFGMSVPAFRTAQFSDEEVYIPLGIVTGHFVPVGVSATTELYPQLGTMFCSRILGQLRNLGYANELTVSEIRVYFNSVAKLVQMHQFITELRGLSDYSDVHTSAPVSAFITNGISGKLVAGHRRLNKILASLPFPSQWIDLYVKGFGITTMSDSPFGPLRMFCPKEFEVAQGEIMTASNTAAALISAINDFYSIGGNVELASILSNVIPTTASLPEKVASFPGFKQGTINNLLNLSYYDGTSNDPVAGDDETVRYFYRRSVVPEGMLTYAPDNNILTTAQGSVWVQNLDIAEGTSSRFGISNTGTTVSITNGPERWTNFGCIWESSLALEGSPGPSVGYVFTTFTNVATGVADLMFNNV